MKLKFIGDYERLKKCVSRTGVAGHWRKIDNQIQYRADDGAVLNWWKSTGTVTFQGPKLATAKLEEQFVQRALKKGLVKDQRADGGLDHMKKQLKHALVDIAKLKKALGNR
jgi:hypothetical protein